MHKEWLYRIRTVIYNPSRPCKVLTSIVESIVLRNIGSTRSGSTISATLMIRVHLKYACRRAPVARTSSILPSSSRSLVMIAAEVVAVEDSSIPTSIAHKNTHPFLRVTYCAALLELVEVATHEPTLTKVACSASRKQRFE